MVSLNATQGLKSIEGYEAHTKALRLFRLQVMDSLRAASIDVLLCPVVGFAAALPIEPKYSTSGMLVFQNFANTLAIPAGTMRSGCVVEERDMEVLRQATEGKEITAAMDKAERDFYTGYNKLSPLHRHMLPVSTEFIY